MVIESTTAAGSVLVRQLPAGSHSLVAVATSDLAALYDFLDEAIGVLE
ncbi:MULTISPECIES: hypothetical protein [unclassified Nocardia]|nr:MULTISPECIES: hypothetical protein [unclassified Nocardia]